MGGGYDDVSTNRRGYAGSYALQYSDQTTAAYIVSVLYCTKDYIYLKSYYDNIYGISRQPGRSWILPYNNIGYMYNKIPYDSDEALVICDLMPESWLLALKQAPYSPYILQIPLNQ